MSDEIVSSEARSASYPLKVRSLVSSSACLVEKLDIHRSRTSVLNGGFNCSPLSDSNRTCWYEPFWKLLVFVSSTFTDTVKERNIILEQILKQLRHRGDLSGIQVSFVDMRWGVVNDNTLDHSTWLVCKREIERCRSESNGLFFISLQSDKYGYTPLPREMNEKNFAARLKDCQDNKLIDLAHKWYNLDKNSLPPVYALRSLSSVSDPEYWNEAHPVLLELFREVQLEGDRYDGLKVGHSVTEWEVRAALTSLDGDLKSPDSSTNHANILWSHRQFSPPGVTRESDPRRLFNDHSDHPSKHTDFTAIKQFMTSALKDSQIITHEVAFLSYQETESAGYREYISQWEASLTDRLNESLSAVMARKREWDQTGCGLGLRGDELSEMLHHSRWAHIKCAAFEGRTELLKSIGDALTHSTPPAVDSSSNYEQPVPLQCVTLALVGSSGCGKTALMAKVADFLHRQQTATVPNRPVIIRFCGTSSGSGDALSLVLSICRQMEFIYKLDTLSCTLRTTNSTDTNTQTFRKVVSYFHSLLLAHPVTLLIDSLDQLISDAYQGRSEVSFLLGACLHPESMLILSTLPDDRTKGGCYFGCETRLRQSRVNIVQVPVLQSETITISDITTNTDTAINTNNEAYQLMTQLLTRKRRTLTAAQWTHVTQSLQVEPTPLYVNLAVRVVSTWTSDTPPQLEPTVRGVINQIFDILCRDFGRLLTHTLVGLITFSKQGISDIEIVDVISLDSAVLDSVFQYFTSDVKRLPMHVWLRIRAQLDGLIVEQTGGCLVWYHRQLKETAVERYSSLEITHIHSLLGRYFSNTFDSALLTDKQITPQYHTINNKHTPFDSRSVVNQRRCVEGAHHLLRAGLLTETVSELCSFETVCCYLRCGEGFTLVGLLVELKSLMSNDSTELLTRSDHYLRWLQLDVYFIQEADPIDRILLSASRQPLCSVVRSDTMLFVERLSAASDCMGVTLKRYPSIVLGGSAHLFPLLRYTLEGHGDEVRVVRYSPDGSLIASGGADWSVKLWDVVTGRLVKSLVGHCGAITDIVWCHKNTLPSPPASQSQLITCALDCSIRLWDIVSGSIVHIFEACVHAASSLAWNSDTNQLVSGHVNSGDVTLWDVSAGSLVLSTRFTDGAQSGGEHRAPVSISSDGKQVAVGFQCGAVRVFNSTTLEESSSFTHRRGDAVAAVAWRPHTTNIAVLTYSGKLFLWNSLTGEMNYAPYSAVHFKTTHSLAWSPSGSHLLASSAYGDTISVYKSDLTEIMAEIRGDFSPSLSLDWSSRGEQICTAGGYDCSVKIWDVPPAVTTAAPDSPLQTLALFEGHTSLITSIVFHPTDPHLLVSTSWDKSVILWDTQMGRQRHRITAANDGTINGLSLSVDGSVVFTWCDSVVKMWSTASYELLWQYSGEAVVTTTDGIEESSVETITVLSICPSPVHISQVAIALRVTTYDSESEQNVDTHCVRILNTSNQSPLVCTLIHTNTSSVIKGLSWNCTSSILSAVVVDGDLETDSVCLWDSKGGALLSSASIVNLVPTESCPNDEQCLLRVTALQWHPARDVMAVGCDDGSIKLRTHTHLTLAIDGGAIINVDTTLIGHDSDVLALSWSHSLGVKLASISSDRTLIIWSCLDSCGDFNTQCVKLIARLKYDDFNMTTVSWSADNQRIAVGSSELVIRVWSEVEMTD